MYIVFYLSEQTNERKLRELVERRYWAANRAKQQVDRKNWTETHGTILLCQYFGHNWYNILKIFNIKIDMLFKCFGEHISPIYLRSKHIQPVL